MHATQTRVLAVDDEARYLRLMRMNLEAEGHYFVGVGSANEALDALANGQFDLAIFDVRMPGMDGFTLLKNVREFSDVPVIFVTALGEEADKVEGLQLGADDYLTKPFGAPELLARVNAVLRRYWSGRLSDELATIGDLRIDLGQHRVFRGEEEIQLSRMEYHLLVELVRHAGKVVPQGRLVHDVWGPDYDEDFEGLRVYIYRLRHKLEKDPNHPELLITYPGIGYMLKRPGAQSAPAA